MQDAPRATVHHGGLARWCGAFLGTAAHLRWPPQTKHAPEQIKQMHFQKPHCKPPTVGEGRLRERPVGEQCVGERESGRDVQQCPAEGLVELGRPPLRLHHLAVVMPGMRQQWSRQQRTVRPHSDFFHGASEMISIWLVQPRGWLHRSSNVSSEPTVCMRRQLF